jgi:hypothetical protein
LHVGVLGQGSFDATAEVAVTGNTNADLRTHVLYPE